jgi:hypothetical protein
MSKEKIDYSESFEEYLGALETALKNGANYKELLKVTPKDFNLPETWSGTVATDKYSSILYAISGEYLLDEPIGLIVRPDLRSIAKDLEAPYSVIMEAYNYKET